MADDRMLREMASDPKFRKILVTDGKTEVGQALVKALVKAGAEIVWVGAPSRGRSCRGVDDIAALQQVDAGAARPERRQLGRRARRRDRRQGRHRRQQRRDASRRRHRSRRGTDVARDEMTSTISACCSLAQAFGPAMGRAAPTASTAAAAWVNMLSVYALSNCPPFGAFSASKAAGSVAGACLRAEMRPGGVSVVNVFPGPIDDEWNQNLPPPKVAPRAVARARS